MKNLISIALLATIWSPVSRADSPGLHGMLLFGGDQVTYASHLPMFHPPHDYQVILKLKLEDLPPGATLAKYKAAQHEFTGIFTLMPEIMDLTQVISGAKTSFKASLFQGHFEQGGTNLGPVKVSVEKVVFSAKLNAQDTSTENQYLVFGESGAYFAAHLIKGKPSVDAILSVNQPQEVFVPHCRTRACADPVNTPVADAQLPLTMDVMAAGENKNQLPKVGESLSALFTQFAEVKKQIYVEEDELAH